MTFSRVQKGQLRRRQPPFFSGNDLRLSGHLSAGKGYSMLAGDEADSGLPAFERLREKEEGVANLLDLYVARYETDAFAVAVTPKKPFDPALREELIAMTERAYVEKFIRITGRRTCIRCSSARLAAHSSAAR